MVTFTGRIVNGKERDYFYYDFDVCCHGVKKSCGGWSQELISGEPGHGSDGDTLAWGYDGDSPRLLSVNMLATTLHPEWLLFPNYFNAYCHKDRALILKRYRAFAKEVVANLPDSWTMTSDEVLAWLKKKEKV